MLEWHRYVDWLLNNDSSFNNISMSFDEGNDFSGVPPIIKASILMLERMIEHQGRYNIMVFPERRQSNFIFALMKLLYNIAEGKIEREYDPSRFVMGERLKFGETIVEFIEVENGVKGQRIAIKLADLYKYSAPIELFPLFQRTNTKRRLSKIAQFVMAKTEAEERLSRMSTDEKQLSLLADYKTHMESSIFYMTSITSTKETLFRCNLCGKKVSDILLIGKVDYTGAIENIGAGQLSGIPAIVLAPDLYAINEAAENGHPIQSIIIDVSNVNVIISQMDALDNLIKLKIPIICVADVVNSLKFQPFVVRGFNVWRWDEFSITKSLYGVMSWSSNLKTRNCATRQVRYLEVDGHEISDAIKMISAHRNESKELSARMMRLFGDLSKLTFGAMRETVPFSEGNYENAHRILDEGLRILLSEKKYLIQSTFDEYKATIQNLRGVYTSDFELLKNKALASHLREQKYRDIYIVVAERADKRRIQDYWQTWCRQNNISTTVCVLYPAEYYSIGETQVSATIVVSWLKRTIMKKILYSFNTQKYVVLIYDYERRWKNYDIAKWSAALNSSNNKTIISSSFSTDKIGVPTSPFVETPQHMPLGVPSVDDFGEIELILRENKYRQYMARGGTKTDGETTEAIPINYVGGYLAFYQTGHKMISATKIIIDDADKIENVLPAQLNVGDFVVVREADHDLIKDIADNILENSGKDGLRKMATKWKEALKIEQVFSTEEEIYQKLKNCGCTRGYQTVKNWIFNEDTIAPDDKQDLQYIADATENKVMSERLDEIYGAAQKVRAAHIQAGKVLSQKLKSRVVGALRDYGDIDPFNIWEPIEMNIEGIGVVRVLKIIDIGSEVIVDTADTNRLLIE